MEKSEWLSQVRKGIVEYSILLVMKNATVYGYELISKLENHETLAVSEGTIYPLLRRLEKNGLIASTWKETIPGTPPRKYYDLTEQGVETLEMMDEGWQQITISIEDIKTK